MSTFTLLFALAVSSGSGNDARHQDDRVVPLGTVRTWYAVLDGDRKIGYAHEQLECISGPRRFRYSLHGEMAVERDGLERHHAVRASALLDGAYAARELRGRFRLNEDETRLSVVTEGAALRMSWTAPGASPRTWRLPDNEDLYALPSQMFYALRQGGALADPGVRRARLLDTRSEGEPVVETVFRVGALERREIGGRRVGVTPVTFLKPPPSSGRADELVRALIDRYGRMIEAVTRSGYRIVWVAGEREAMEGITFLPRRDRNDPFDKVRAFRPWPDAPAAPADATDEAVSADALDSTFAQARKDLAELREHRDAGRIAEVRTGYLALLKTWKLMRATAADEVPSKLAELDAFRDACEEVWDGAGRVLREGLAIVERARTHLREDDCAGLESRLQELRKRAARLEVEHRPEGETLSRWITRLEPELSACRIRRELLGFPLAVTGTTFAIRPGRAVIDPSLFVGGARVGREIEVPFLNRQGRAIVNGDVYRAGDVEKRTGVTIEEVRKHGITVSYKGQLRDVPLFQR